MTEDPAPQNNAPLGKRKVLLVDDDERNLYALARALKHRGAEVVVAENGQGALDVLLEDDQIDIVLMDIMMPEMDGYEAIKKIRAINRVSSIPIIALTANAMVGDRDKCIAAGASDYLSKPVALQSLMEKINVWISE